MGKETDDPELRAALEEKFGLDKPLPVQYVNYLKTAMSGDLGTSIIYNRPVSDIIVEKLPATILLVLTSGVLSLIIGTAMGIIAARKEGSAIDFIFSGLSYILNSMPSFWLALMLIIVFSSKLGWLPTCGMTDPRASYTGKAYVLDVIKHMILPVGTLLLVEIPLYFRIAKSSVLQVTNEDFILTLRATGMNDKKDIQQIYFQKCYLTNYYNIWYIYGLFNNRCSINRNCICLAWYR